MMKKEVEWIVLTAVLALLVVLVVYSPEVSLSPEGQEANYIIQFKEKSVLEIRAEKIKENNGEKDVDKNYKNAFDSQKKRIKSEQDKFFRDNPSIKYRRKFDGIFNGVSVYLSEEELEKVKKHPNVKRVYPNLDAEITLIDSPHVMGFDWAWTVNSALQPESCVLFSDINLDGVISSDDTNIITGKIGCESADFDYSDDSTCFRSDVNRDGRVNSLDVNLVQSRIGLPLDSGNCLTGKGVTIAVLDTGTDYTHQDLGGCTEQEFLTGNCERIIGGIDTVNEDVNPMDDMGHGTHTASIAAGYGILYGVAPKAKLYIGKIMNSGGLGKYDNMIAGIQNATDPNNDGDYSDRVDIISMSLSQPCRTTGYIDDCGPNDPLSQATDMAVENGVVVSVSAGNNGKVENSTGVPAVSRKSLTIGATDKQDEIAMFSSIGPVVWTDSSGSHFRLKPDVVATGVNVCAAEWGDRWASEHCLDEEHVSLSGTSMSAPHVAGVVALILQKNPDWTPDEVKSALRGTAVNLPGWSIVEQGAGRVSVQNVLNFEGIPSVVEVETGGEQVGEINIRGTAMGRDFSSYSLYYYPDRGSPDDKTIITTRTIPVNDGILYSGFDVGNIVDGEYVLMVDSVNSLGSVASGINLLIVDNAKITSQLGNDVLRAGDLIEVKGIVRGSFDYYKVEYKKLGTETWLNNGVSLTNGGSSEVVGVIATWDTSGIAVSDFYTIRLRSYLSSGEITEEFVENIYLDMSLKEGWPQRISYSEISSGFLEPVVEDIDNDGEKEIIVYKKGSPPKVLAYSPDGTLKWAADIGEYETSVFFKPSVPIVGDLDNNGFKEIAVYNLIEPESGFYQARLYVFNYDGILKLSVEIIKDKYPRILMADVNSDGSKEIIVKGNEDVFGGEEMAVLNNNGAVISQWNLPDVKISNSIVGSPAVGNLQYRRKYFAWLACLYGRDNLFFTCCCGY